MVIASFSTLYDKAGNSKARSQIPTFVMDKS